MSIEKYSREAFEKNEEEIDRVRKPAQQNPFNAQTDGTYSTDPGDILDAKMRYQLGKQERENLLNKAHEEAIEENKKRMEKKKFKISDLIDKYPVVIIETESKSNNTNNTYTIQKNPDGTCTVTNKNLGTTKKGKIEKILGDATVEKGVPVYFGNGDNTTAVKSVRWEATKK